MDNNKKMLAIQASAEDYEWQILDRVKETQDTFTYIFSPVTTSQRFPFSIGQFVTISAHRLTTRYVVLYLIPISELVRPLHEDVN